MDAREVIRHFLQGTDLSCDDLITALEWHGNRIIHDSENHGPTLERIAEALGQAERYDTPVFDDIGMQESPDGEWLTVESAIAAIRAMGEKK